MRKSRRCFVGTLAVVLLLAASAWATPLGTIERNARRLANTRMADREITVFSKPGFAVWVRPAARVIGVQRGLFRSQGFFINRDGKVRSGDREELGRLLQRHAPGLSSRAVRRNLLGQIRQFKVHERALKRQDPLINGLLQQAAGTGQQRVLWQGRRGSLSYNPVNNVLVGADRHGTQGFFLTRGAKGGLSVQSHHQNELREFIYRSR